MTTLAAGTLDVELACPIRATLRRNPVEGKLGVSGGRGGERVSDGQTDDLGSSPLETFDVKDGGHLFGKGVTVMTPTTT